jgi:hypothetical protein
MAITQHAHIYSFLTSIFNFENFFLTIFINAAPTLSHTPPIVTWFAIRLMIIFGIIFCWALQQVDFVMAYPQAPIEMDIYMELPQGIQTKHGNSKKHVLKLVEMHIYGQKQTGHVWDSFLVDKLTSIGFTMSVIDDCFFFCNDVIFMVYVDDDIFQGKKTHNLKKSSRRSRI